MEPIDDNLGTTQQSTMEPDDIPTGTMSDEDGADDAYSNASDTSSISSGEDNVYDAANLVIEKWEPVLDAIAQATRNACPDSPSIASTSSPEEFRVFRGY